MGTTWKRSRRKKEKRRGGAKKIRWYCYTKEGAAKKYYAKFDFLQIACQSFKINVPLGISWNTKSNLLQWNQKQVNLYNHSISNKKYPRVLR